jgi:hypothetical protein
MAPQITLRHRNAPTAVMATAVNYNTSNQPHFAETLAPRTNVIYEISNVIQSLTGEASLVNFRRANTVKNSARNSINFGEGFKVRKMIHRSNGSRKLARKRRSTRRRRA